MKSQSGLGVSPENKQAHGQDARATTLSGLGVSPEFKQAHGQDARATTRRRFLRQAGWAFTGLIFVPKLIRAQSILTAPGLASFQKKASGGGGGSTYSLIAHVGAQATGNTPTTSSAIDTTGANLLVAITPFGDASTTPPALTDSKSNAWSHSAQYVSFNPKIVFQYCINPTVGTGHTFTSQNTSGSGYGLHLYAFKKSSGTPALDAEAASGGTSNWGSGAIHPGSLTPATSSDVFVSGVVCDGSTVTGASVDSGFSEPEAFFQGASFYGADSAYKIKTDALAENPAWTCSPTFNADANTIAICFK